MNEKQNKVLKTALWMAYNSSVPMGMGFWQATTTKQKTEEPLWDICKEMVETRKGSAILYTDYVFGRMVKTTFSVTADGELTINGGEEPKLDYQSWCADFPSNKDFVNAVYERIN
jgi:hypothetical protein